MKENVLIELPTTFIQSLHVSCSNHCNISFHIRVEALKSVVLLVQKMVVND
mgnify:CR=1 FL=1